MTNTSTSKAVTKCLSCNSNELELVIDLGVHPLANSLLSNSSQAVVEKRFPLGLQVCKACWLVQLTHLIPPVDIYSDYLYFSSFSDEMLRHAKKATESYRNDYGVNEESFVVEIASNDGYLLKNFQEAAVPCLGIEPAANIAKVAREIGIETLELFFSSESAGQIAESHGKADLILGNNVFAHAPDTNDFVAGLAGLLKPGGRVVLEFPYVVDFLANTEFDTVYHEHVFYFSLTALRPLFQRHGLRIVGAEKIAIHGGSLRLTACHEGEHAPCESVENLCQEEKKYGIASIDCYEAFARRVAGIRESIRQILAELKDGGSTVAAYGASAKGSTLLNYCNIGAELLDFVVDRSTYKQGRLTPGTHLPIFPPEILRERQPDYTLLLTWNFAEEILKQQDEYRKAGGRFIVPIPEPKIV